MILDKQKEIRDFLRNCDLQIVLVLIKMYKKTKDKNYYEEAKFYGKRAKSFK